jgi:hypothetical protein
MKEEGNKVVLSMTKEYFGIPMTTEEMELAIKTIIENAKIDVESIGTVSPKESERAASLLNDLNGIEKGIKGGKGNNAHIIKARKDAAEIAALFIKATKRSLTKDTWGNIKIQSEDFSDALKPVVEGGKKRAKPYSAYVKHVITRGKQAVVDKYLYASSGKAEAMQRAKDTYLSIRSNGADRLDQIRYGRKVGKLINDLSNEESSIRENSVEELVKIGKPAVGLLIKAGNQDENIRRDVAGILEKQGAVTDELKKQWNINDGGKRAPWTPKVVVLGGPDGVILPYDKFRKSTLKDSFIREPLVDLLREGQQVVLISNLRYYDDDRTGEKGLASRVVEYIPFDARQNLTVYASAGTFKVEFDGQGVPQTDNNYNNWNYIPEDDVEMIRATLEKLGQDYWEGYEKGKSTMRNTYLNYPFRKPEVILHKDVNGRVYSASIINLPSKELDLVNLKEGELSVREECFDAVKQVLKDGDPVVWEEDVVGKAGVTSIDIRKDKTGKDRALINYLRQHKIRRGEDAVIFGNMQSYAQDNEFLKVEGVRVFNNDIPRRMNDIVSADGLRHIGYGLGVVYYFLEGMAAGRSFSELTRAGDFCSRAAVTYLKRQSIKRKNKTRTFTGRMEELFDIYQQFSLSYLDYAGWTELYQEGMGIDKGSELDTALNEVKEAYKTAQSVEEYFAAADAIYAEHEGLDLLLFYAGVDPRMGRTAAFLESLYKDDLRKSGDNLKSDILTGRNNTGLPISRIMAGYFQDGYYQRYKDGVSKQYEGRGPPEDNNEKEPQKRLVYLGGGGKATTTLLQKFIAKGKRLLACIISSSDDGGASWDVMASLFNKLGMYFIPPGDASGLAIFLSNDNFKIFTLFWSESDADKMPEYITTKGRISAERLYPVWQKRLREVLTAIEDPARKAEIENLIGKILKDDSEKFNKPEDYLVFTASMLNLGELIDR